MPSFSHRSDGFKPSEYFLNALSFALADRVAGVSCGSLIDRTTSVGYVHCDVWRDVSLAHSLNNFSCVIALIRTKSDALISADRLDHLNGGGAFRRSGGERQSNISDESVAILHQRMPDVCQARLVRRALAKQTRIRISRGFVSFVRAFRIIVRAGSTVERDASKAT